MFRFVSRLPVVLALAIASTMGLAGSSLAGEQVPFKGVLAGPYTVTPIPMTPTATLVVSAEGVATHLGFFDVEIPHVVNFAMLSATGTYQFTAANGDKVNGTFTGQSTPIGTDGVYVLVVEEVTIVGGTGRFRNATGSFTTVRLVNRLDLTTSGYFDGTISRPRRR